jgi:DNA-directed RNA polymerase III subunit RPC4
LPSIKKRDLTLCTTSGSSKKTFTPTIPGRRVKKEIGSSDDVKMVKQTVKDPDKQGKGRGPKGRGRGREVITSSSVFSMGPADKKIGFGGPVTPSVTPTGSSRQIKSPLTKPSPGGAGRVKAQPGEKTAHLMDEPMDVSEGGGYMDPFEDSANPPILLPLDYSLHGIKEKMAAANVKQKEKSIDSKLSSQVQSGPDEIKPPENDEKSSEGVSSISVGVSSTSVDVSDRLVGVSTSELFSRSDDPRAKMLLLQLPDVLPSSDGEKCLPLSEMKESGFVGKLKVHKSGKVRLHFGGIVLDVTMATPCSYRQDVVTMDTDSKELTHLGGVSHKVVCTPNFDHLLPNT